MPSRSNSTLSGGVNPNRGYWLPDRNPGHTDSGALEENLQPGTPREPMNVDTIDAVEYAAITDSGKTIDGQRGKDQRAPYLESRQSHDHVQVG